jgi:medium-chain acyl-[acyl-carrier-protein] hydrolase
MRSQQLAELTLCRRPNPAARLRLICFPFAGATSHSFSGNFEHLPERIRDQIEIWSVVLPGHVPGQAGAVFVDLAPLVAYLDDQLVELLQSPFAFFGHSMGALISFELARRLDECERVGPAHVLISGRRAPTRPGQSTHLHRLSDDQLRRRLRTLGGTPEEVLGNDELLALVLPILRADLQLCESYVFVPSAPLACSMTAMYGARDEHLSAADVVAWEEQTTGAFSWHRVPGRHFFLEESRAIAIDRIAQDLTTVLRRIGDR